MKYGSGRVLVVPLLDKEKRRDERRGVRKTKPRVKFTVVGESKGLNAGLPT